MKYRVYALHSDGRTRRRVYKSKDAQMRAIAQMQQHGFATLDARGKERAAYWQPHLTRALKGRQRQCA